MAERAHEQLPDSVLVDWLRIATDRRLGALLEAFRRGWSIEKVHEITRITRWFLQRFERIANMESDLVNMNIQPSSMDYNTIIRYKSHGFSDAHIADALNGFKPAGWKALPDHCNEESVMHRRHELNIHPRYRMVDSCAAEFAAKTPYYYSTYEPYQDDGIDHVPDLEKRNKQRMVAIGSGPIRIGQGIEFDLSLIHI